MQGGPAPGMRPSLQQMPPQGVGAFQQGNNTLKSILQHHQNQMQKLQDDQQLHPQQVSEPRQDPQKPRQNQHP